MSLDEDEIILIVILFVLIVIAVFVYRINVRVDRLSNIIVDDSTDSVDSQ